MKKYFAIIALIASFMLIACDDSSNNHKDDGKVRDIDGNIYDTIKICDQTWLVENLNVAHYRNGETIPEVKDSADWANLTTKLCRQELSKRR